MTEQQQQEIRNKIETLITEAEKNLAMSEHCEDTPAADAIDQAAQQTQRDTMEKVLARQKARLASLKAAKERLCADPDNYGVCRQCGEDIAFNRLLNMPETPFCVGCAA